jgi:creatinine amidohydrolase
VNQRGALFSLTTDQAGELLKRTQTVLVPFGAVEQHGPGIPLGTDIIVAEVLAKRIAEKIDVLVVPVLPVGVSYFHMGFPGTITVKTETYAKFVEEMTLSIIQNGARYIVYINGHMGNKSGLELAAINVQAASEARVVIVNPCMVADTLFEGEIDSGHAGRVEADFVLAYDPALIDMEKASSKPGWESKVKTWRGKPKIDIYKIVKEFSLDQTFSNAKGASREEAKVVVDRITDEIILQMGEIFGSEAIVK